MAVYYFLLYFFVYGFLGWCAEVVFAAFKHKSFVNRGFLNGPICPIYGLGIGLVVHLLRPIQSNIVLLYVTSMVLVTALEWLTGFLLEKIFHNKWWDYSHIPFNLNGYVCLPFSLIWGAACVIIVRGIHPLFHKAMVHLPLAVGGVLLVLFGIGLIADLYVTAAGIFKINRRLASMEKIAAELRELSDSLGESLYKSAVEALEKGDEAKQKLEAPVRFYERTQERTQEFQEHTQERIQELRDKYNELAAKRNYTTKRLTRAFPSMKAQKYKDAWEELRKRWKLK